MLTKYIGRTVDIIYQDRHGQFTQRRVQVHGIKDGRAKVYCHTAGSPRVLLLERILAVQPIHRSA